MCVCGGVCVWGVCVCGVCVCEVFCPLMQAVTKPRWAKTSMILSPWSNMYFKWTIAF